MPPDVEVPLLVRAAAGGDQSAWDALVARFVALVWAVARGHGLGTSAAADVAQTTWLRLVESLHTVPDHAVGAWLAATTRTEALHALRWADPRLEVRARKTEAQDISRALLALPPRSRLALRLLAVPGVTHEEIAAGLGLDVADTQALVAQSLGRLSAELAHELANVPSVRESVP